MNTELPRKIEVARNHDQTREITIKGEDERGNLKEDTIFCTTEEAEQIERFFGCRPEI